MQDGQTHPLSVVGNQGKFGPGECRDNLLRICRRKEPARLVANWFGDFQISTPGSLINVLLDDPFCPFRPGCLLLLAVNKRAAAGRGHVINHDIWLGQSSSTGLSCHKVIGCDPERILQQLADLLESDY